MKNPSSISMTFQKKTKYIERLFRKQKDAKDLLPSLFMMVTVMSQLTVANHNQEESKPRQTEQAILSCFASQGYLSLSPSICSCLPQSVYGLVFADLYHSFNQSVFALKPSLFVLFHITPFVFTSSICLPCPHIHLINLFSCPPSVHLW